MVQLQDITVRVLICRIVCHGLRRLQAFSPGSKAGAQAPFAGCACNPGNQQVTRIIDRRGDKVVGLQPFDNQRLLTPSG